MPIVRPAWNDTVLVKRLLDLGAPGLLFPMVQSVEEAERAVAATRYPPRGVRGVSMSQRGNRFGRVGDYFERVEAETCVLVQIETEAALAGNRGNRLGRRCRRGVLRPGGSRRRYGASRSTWRTRTCGRRSPRARRPRAGPASRRAPWSGTTTKAIELFKAGFGFVACSSDLNILVRSADAQLAEIRGALK